MRIKYRGYLMRMKKIAAAFAALTVGAALVTGAATSADANSAAGAKKIKECKGKQLKVSLGKKGAAAGSSYQAIRIRNTGRVCSINSWPEIGYASKHGTPVGHFAKHGRTWPGKVVLTHGQRGRLQLQAPNPGNFPKRVCRPAKATKIAAYVPGSIRPSSRHANRIKRPVKVCTTRRGRPSLLYRMG
ncbi:DUF4232 domain-containing protein [Solicola gregarius]|uniref:DUF4232 domain-containing protein n=1 Tax=Solicola gregarius TaxID=2908642 RepID=A0AA46TKY3_9ACTN|nr:DUF4232 domain-containing protein [Solicola gregarius]UYM07224.1 DUF4232 domain-containing protein [Solicola gregarius]